MLAAVSSGKRSSALQRARAGNPSRKFCGVVLRWRRKPACKWRSEMPSCHRDIGEPQWFAGALGNQLAGLPHQPGAGIARAWPLSAGRDEGAKAGEQHVLIGGGQARREGDLQFRQLQEDEIERRAEPQPLGRRRWTRSGSASRDRGRNRSFGRARRRAPKRRSRRCRAVLIDRPAARHEQADIPSVLASGSPRPLTERQPRSASTRTTLSSFSVVIRTWLNRDRVMVMAPRTDLHAGMLEAVARPQRLITADPRMAALDDGPGIVGIGGGEPLEAGRRAFACHLHRNGRSISATLNLRRNPGHCSQSVDWMATIATEPRESINC